MKNKLSEKKVNNYLDAYCNTSIETFVFDEIGSTNDFAKSLEVTGDTALIVANCQTAGRGRLGRTFESPKGSGLYMTLVRKVSPSDLRDLTKSTTMAAVAVRHGISKVTGQEPKIKWVNDVYLNGLKVCGILTEYVNDKLIIGIGINCFPGSFPKELDGKAGFISPDTESFSREELAAAVISKLLTLLDGDEDFMDEYRKHCFILGKYIMVHPHLNDTSYRAKALEITDDGELVVEYEEMGMQGKRETLSTGEVSIKNWE